MTTPLAAAQRLRSTILENRDTTETGRQLADPIIRGLIENNLGRLALPDENGDPALPPSDAFAVFETLAAAEASVAWIVWNSSLPCWFSRFLNEESRREIFGDRKALYASSTRPTGRAARVGESFVVTGRWSLVSGCMHASWIPVMCMVEKNGELEMLAADVPHMRMLFFRQDAHEIIDTWHVGGLRGTGSHDVALTDAAVPAAWSFAIGDPSLIDSPMGRMPITCTMGGGCASICLGIAKTALQALVALATEKQSVDGGPGVKDRAPVQSLVARVETQMESMRERLRQTCDKLWNAARAGGAIELTDIGDMFSAAITTAQLCRAAVTDIYAAAGTSSLYTDNPIERAHRDIHAVLQHVVLQPFWMEQAGRVRLGLEPDHPLFRI